ncbi:hypothetical protein LTR85_007801 [Meristemomyces frigidus]|nr:hypothetical protein LTR85_007801 [Meristemomyces frigidus]
MNKKQFRSQASSGRLGSGIGAFGSSGFGSTQSSPLSYIQEPPNYSDISDANAVVAFKNLSKRDSTTKAKALEDIQAYIASSQVDTEDGLLEAWVRLNELVNMAVDSDEYNSGPWLAGGYDSDRAASKAAQESLALVFPTADKVAALKKTFHGPILEYCRDAVLHESVQTLSDERAVTPEDAQATYARVVATSLAVITSLLSELSSEELSKQHHAYSELFVDTKLWDFAIHADAALRRSLHRLVQTALSKQPDLIESNLKAVSNAYVNKGLPSDQTGSAADFVSTLDALSASCPSIWTDAYSGKKPAASRFKQFLKHGSRSGSSEFWERTSRLFARIPQVVLPQSFEEAKEVLLAARDGVTRKEERFSASVAWPAFFTLAAVVTAGMQDNDRDQLIDSCIMPVIRQYLQPSPETADWAITGAKASSLVAKAAGVSQTAVLLEREWPQLADQLIETAKVSQPQQSKDFDRSQMHVASTGERWAALQRELFATSLPESLRKVLVSSSTNVVKECAQLLETREGKPFGAAAIIEELLRTSAAHLMADQEFTSAIEQVLMSDQIDWVFWPSRRHLIRCLYAVSSETFFPEVLKRAFRQTMDQAGSIEISYRTLQDFFPRNAPKEAVAVARQHSELQDFVAQASEPGLNDLEGSLFLALYRVGALSDDTTDKVMSKLIGSLSDTDDLENLPATLSFFSDADDGTLRAMAASGNGEQLLPNLLRLEQHHDEEVARKAAAISSRLSAADGQAATEARFGVVLQNLQSVSRMSLPMDALHDLTNRLLGSDRRIQAPAELLPSLELWTSALKAVVRVPSPSLALLSPLGGAVHLVQTATTEARSTVQSDGEGISQALRIAIYVSRLMAETDMKDRLHDLGDDKWTVIALLYVTALLAEENLSVLGANALWNPHSSQDLEPVILDFVTETNAVLSDVWQTTTPDLKLDEKPAVAVVLDYSKLFAALDQLRQDQSKGSAVLYYVALASANINANLFEIHGHSAEQAKASEVLLRKARSSRDALATTACIVGLQHPLAGTQTSSRFCNELVAELTDLDMSDPQHEQKALEQLVQLNTILQTQDEALDTIAKQRLIFLVKRLVPALNTGITLAITAEICKALALLLPGMQDMYGDHWAQVLSYLISFWTSVESGAGGPAVNEGRILITHASLKLYATLRKLAKAEEANDDLVDALKEDSERVSDSLVLLLKSANGVSDENHQPLMITHELLARQISQLPRKPVQDADELYPLLYTPSRAIQQAAFDLLHKHIPAAQEQLSLEVALDNKTAQLPEEVLSLILEAPTLDSLVDASVDRSMPLQLQGYLYSWRLLFAHFNGSSYRVKTDYVEQLKDGSYLSGLLNFTFDFLGHSRGKPVDASKFDILEYTPDVEPSPERDVQWLLTHLYYLALTHLPSLVKTYYLDIRSRQTSLAVESWTAKYISPLIISTSLQAVAEWSEKSVKEDPEYEKMSVKVGTKSKEVYASYIVDEQTMAIKVVLPEAYPLASAQVVGVSRVAVNEEKWRSWLRNSAGVITFSNGSITDGLSAWRKNVTGALKGQTECAICYSIIDSQKQLPTKRCPTCKNLFHSSCLFKWFKTSNASTCPLCRNAFNFN